ncbi:MAG: hypothetical protein RBQ65_06450 [Sphaerochaeta sp.]|nr:hypothetical protein [Sphaerochaeta sp.]
MSRSGLIALIIIAVLTVAGGVYWYLEFVPLSDLDSKKTTEVVQQPEVETTVASAPPAPVVVEAREESHIEPLLPSEPIAAEVVVPAMEEAEPILEEGQLEEAIGDEVEVTIIPFSELEELFGSEYFALSEPLPVDLSVFGSQTEQGEDADYAGDLAESVDIVEVEDVEAEEDEPAAVIPFVAEEETVDNEEVEITAVAPIEREEEAEITAVAPIETEPKAVPTELGRSESVPTVRAQVEPKESNWLVGAKISILHLDLPSFDSAGFGFEVDFMRRQNDLFSWGGTVAVNNDADAWQLDLLASARWTPAVNAKLNFPLTISLGPSVHVAPNAGFAVAAQASVGISYSLIRDLSFFYEAGVAARYVVGSGFAVGLKPLKVGFAYSF